MYVERDDFLEHEREFRSLCELAERFSIPLGGHTVILDTGAGQGMHAGFLSSVGARVYCCDVIDYTTLYNGEFARLLREKYQRNGYFIALERITFLQSDVTDLILRDALVDLVVAFNLFEHVADPRAALHELVRVTKPGGHLFITFDPIWTADTGSHFVHRVPEPWSHLVLGEQQFEARMAAAGAPEAEVQEYRSGMNRWRLRQYEELFADTVRRLGLRVVEQNHWSGVVNESHLHHAHFDQAQRLGYAREELLTRGLRFILGR